MTLFIFLRQNIVFAVVVNQNSLILSATHNCATK